MTSAAALLDNPVFSLGPPSAREQLLAHSRLLTLTGGERVLSEGEPAKSIYALDAGAVRVFHQTANGDEVSLKLFRSPAIFGEAEAFSGVAFQENVETLEASRIVVMPTDAVRAFLRTVPAAAIGFLEDVAARLAIASYHQRSLAFNPITMRLANFLLDYAEWTHDSDDAEWRVALSQDDMASAIGATRRSIGKDVTAWRKEGILLRRGSVYLVRQPGQLERFADPARLRLMYRAAIPGGVDSLQPKRYRTPR